MKRCVCARPIPREWGRVAEGLARVEVPGGWLYRAIDERGVALAFVPEPPLKLEPDEVPDGCSDVEL